MAELLNLQGTCQPLRAKPAHFVSHLPILERVHKCLLCIYEQPIDPHISEKAFSQVYNYFRQNRREMQQIVETEVDITIEKGGYVLTGRIDLLMEKNGKLELLDFKTAPRPTPDADWLIGYERQLCTYAYALEKRYNRRPERLLLYWTGEQRREDAIMEFRYRAEMVEMVGRSIDATVGRIKEKDFRIVTVPELQICRGCDIKHFCMSEGIVKPSVLSY
jgi:DNA helicase-2/ATP-dependent DNA helicase PcrA